MAADADLYAPDPSTRLAAARGLSPRARRRLVRHAPDWPTLSPGALNAWLLLVTTKPPHWREPLLPWPEEPLSLGEPHPGFLYPDPIGFWAEVRRWSIAVFTRVEPTWRTAEALALTTLVHCGEDASVVELAQRTCRPRVVLYLDEQAAAGAPADLPKQEAEIPDPHRGGQAYAGWWATLADGTVLGKAPQHPTMHRLYDSDDMAGWLQRWR